MDFSKSQKATLQRAQEEIQDLLLDLQSGTLDRITLEGGLKTVRKRLVALEIHEHSPDADPTHNPGSAPGKGPDRQ